MNCQKCGAILIAGDSFCRKCGASINTFTQNVNMNNDANQLASTIGDNNSQVNSINQSSNNQTYQNQSVYNNQPSYNQTYQNQSVYNSQPSNNQTYQNQSVYNNQPSYNQTYQNQSVYNSQPSDNQTYQNQPVYNNQPNYSQYSQPAYNNEYLDEDLKKAYIGEKYDDFKKGVGATPVLIFFLGIFYVLYRKMYLLALLWIVASTILSIFLPGLGIIISFGFTIFMMIKFRDFYLKHVDDQVKKIKENNPNASRDELIKICTKKGGTNLVAALVPPNYICHYYCSNIYSNTNYFGDYE